MKRVWVTALAKEAQRVQKTLSMLKTYALDADGHFWDDDLQKMAWMGARPQLTDPETALWLILSDDASLAADPVRYGLSMLTLSVQGVRGHGFPCIVVHAGEALPAAPSLPTPLQGGEVLPADHPTLGAKIVAAANTPPAAISADYRLDVYAVPQIGQWLEVGPSETEWKGAMFGVCGAEIDAHGVGPAGRLPQKAVLEYPQQGLTLNAGEKEYTAWAVRNRLDSGSSYYVRVQGEPEAILFGPPADSDDADVFVVRLK